MLTRTLRSEDGLSAQPQPVPLKYKRNRVLFAPERNELRSLYLQTPKVSRTFGASLILIFIEY
ncbi:hypothetical protein F6P88_03145 [Streptococcus suis]|nr:hypothetical protein [Streptococcus suis]MBS8058321.1 hypothetical protein [Streptococcus suis]MBS8113421.1 hypothetical protein [Streptococcus suis]